MKKFILLSLLAVLLGTGTMKAQDEMFKALYMYNFTRYVQWPTAYRSGEFVIVVIGGTPGMAQELEKIANRKKVVNQTIVIKKASSLEQVGKCHMVYLGENKSNLIDQAVQAFRGKPTLIVTDKPGLCKLGAAINLVKVDGKQKFEVNSGNITGSGLQVSNELEVLGIKVSN